jgi:hypothetical protein
VTNGSKHPLSLNPRAACTSQHGPPGRHHPNSRSSPPSASAPPTPRSTARHHPPTACRAGHQSRAPSRLLRLPHPSSRRLLLLAVPAPPSSPALDSQILSLRVIAPPISAKSGNRSSWRAHTTLDRGAPTTRVEAAGDCASFVAMGLRAADGDVRAARRRANDCPGSRAVFTLVMLSLASLTPRYYVPTTETTRSATTSCNSASSM